MARRWKSTDWDDLDAIQQVYYFVFGGSTTFGYGESDNLTIPSNLQYYLREAFQTDQSAVYNFGRAFYFSSQ
jgi:hypothetical protein